MRHAAALVAALVLGAALVAGPAAARGGLGGDIDRLLDRPPFDRATWAVLVTDSTGRTVYERSPDRLMVPASCNKLLVCAAALGLLGPDWRTTTSLYGTGALDHGVLHGDLVAYGGGDPGFSTRCYTTDTLAANRCDSVWTGIDALADALVARGLRRIEGAVVGDGSAFEPQLTHPAWEQYDLNWWYAAPVSGLGFNDNCVDITWKPGTSVGDPARVAFAPDLGLITFENRSRTTPAGATRTIDFYRRPGTMALWAEGTLPVDGEGLTEYFALPDPNLYFAAALRARLARRGVTIAKPCGSTTDSLRYRAARQTPPLTTRDSRPVGELIFPILNTSQNWFAEMLLKQLGRVRGDGGSWKQGLAVERRFFIDTVGIDSTALATEDGSGLATSNLVTPRALTQLVRYAHSHAGAEAFTAALPRSGRPGSLRRRFVGTPLEGRVVAKTGSIAHVHTLAGWIERPQGGPLYFAIMANAVVGPERNVLARIDSVVTLVAR